MRKPTTIETVGTLTGLGVGAVLGGVVVRGMTDNTPAASGRATAPVEAVVAHTENREGRPIGVRTWASPLTDEKRGARADGAEIDVVCIEPNGRELTDTDVPPGDPTNRGNDWYLITGTTDKGRQEWVSTSYVEITASAGSAAVVECATIEGLDPRN